MNEQHANTSSKHPGSPPLHERRQERVGPPASHQYHTQVRNCHCSAQESEFCSQHQRPTSLSTPCPATGARAPTLLPPSFPCLRKRSIAIDKTLNPRLTLSVLPGHQGTLRLHRAQQPRTFISKRRLLPRYQPRKRRRVVRSL